MDKKVYKRLKMDKKVYKRILRKIKHLPESNLSNKDKSLGEYQVRLLTKECGNKRRIIVTEKYDGSCVGVLRRNNEVFALTKSGYLARDSKHEAHQTFADYVQSKKAKYLDLLDFGEVAVCEWLFVAHGTRYYISENTSPIIHLDLLDIYGNSIPFDVSRKRFKDKGFGCARVIHDGCAIEHDRLLGKLYEGTDCFRSLEGAEGMVYRCEKNGELEFRGKWVRGDYEPLKYFSKGILFNTRIR